MSIIDNIRTYFENRRLKKLQKDIDTLKDKFNYNPFLSGVRLPEYYTQLNYTRRLAEYKTWGTGSAVALRLFYMYNNFSLNYGTSPTLNYFWKQAPADRRLVHSGIPRLISTRMGDILFKNGVDITATAISKDGAEIKDSKATLTDFVEMLARDYLFLSNNLQKSAFNESSLGHSFLRLSYDVNSSPFPILEAYDLTQAEVIKNRGITTAIIFNTYYTRKERKYKLAEIYSTVENGDACISYKLYEMDNNKEKEIDLLAIPETAEMFSNINFNGDNTIIFDGLKGMLAFEKPNKTPSTEFDTVYGESDYAGSIDLFDAIDEVVSANVREIRTNETKRYIPENMIPRDENNGNALPIDEFCNSYVTVNGDLDQNAKNEITITTIPDKTSSYFEKWKSLLNMIANNVGISPYSLGMTYNEAVQPSADSQRERNRITLDTRAKKLTLWEPLVKQLLAQAVQFTKWIKNNAINPSVATKWQEVYSRYKIIDDEFTPEITVDFGEYIEESDNERIAKYLNIYERGAADLYDTLKGIHLEWSEEQINNKVELIRFEKGMSTDNPSNLPELTGLEEETENNE